MINLIPIPNSIFNNNTICIDAYDVWIFQNDSKLDLIYLYILTFNVNVKKKILIPVDVKP